MKDEIAKEIVDELRLIREDLQNLTMAIRSKTSNFENSYTGKSRKSYQPRVPYPPIVILSFSGNCWELQTS
jgi:hypothetical protein